MTLDECRQKIDRIDAAIIDLLNQRAEISKVIGEIKARAGIPVLDRRRESEVLDQVYLLNEGPIDNSMLARIYAEILLESRRIQNDAAALELNIETVELS